MEAAPGMSTIKRAVISGHTSQFSRRIAMQKGDPDEFNARFHIRCLSKQAAPAFNWGGKTRLG
jgi:hypothetical protein